MSYSKIALQDQDEAAISIACLSGPLEQAGPTLQTSQLIDSTPVLWIQKSVLTRLHNVPGGDPRGHEKPRDAISEARA